MKEKLFKKMIKAYYKTKIDALIKGVGQDTSIEEMRARDDEILRLIDERFRIIGE